VFHCHQMKRSFFDLLIKKNFSNTFSLFWNAFIYLVCYMICFNLLLLCQYVLIGRCLLYVLMFCQTLYLALLIHVTDCTVKSEVGFKMLKTNYNEDKIVVVKPQDNMTAEDKLVVRKWFRRESVNWTQMAQDRLQWQVFVAVIMVLEYHISRGKSLIMGRFFINCY
jgi:hypothetical protein